MSTEVEAKFQLPDPAATARVQALARLGSYALGDPRQKVITDEYYDTRSRALLAAGWALRIRRGGGGCLVTLKSVRSARADVHAREELETELPAELGVLAATDQPPPPAQWPASAARDKAQEMAGEAPLELLFRLEQERQVRDVLDGSRRVATASVDDVRLAFHGTSRQWWELEVELSEEGTDTDLLAMSGWIRASLGLYYSTESKFERSLKAVQEAQVNQDAPVAQVTSAQPSLLRRSPRRRSPNQGMIVLEAPAGAAESLPLVELSARGYRAHLQKRTTDEIVFHDTHDGAFAKRGYVLSWSRAYGNWRLREDGRVRAEHRGTRESVPLEGAIGDVLGTIPAEHPTIALLEASLEQSDYAVSGIGTDPFRIRARRWEVRSVVVPAAARTMMRLTVEGPSAAVAYLSAILQEQLGYRVSSQTVLDRGLQLLGISAPGSAPPREFRVDARDTVRGAFRKVLRAEAWRMRMNAAGAARDLHPEFVHDLRVATRRARSAGRVFADALVPAVTNAATAAAPALREELRWIARMLGAVRDLDVLSSRLDVQLAQAGAAPAFAGQVRSAVAARRALALGDLVPALESPRFTSLVQMLESEVGESSATAPSATAPSTVEHADLSPTVPSQGDQSVGPFARKRINRAFRKLLPWIEKPAEALGEAELHRIRILFKRLRYACEFFRPLLGGPADAMIGSFVSFQDCLGLHQDAAAAVRVLTEILQQAPPAVRTEDFLLSMGSLIQVQRDIQLTQRQKFLRLWESAPRLLESWKRLRAQVEATV